MNKAVEKFVVFSPFLPFFCVVSSPPAGPAPAWGSESAVAVGALGCSRSFVRTRCQKEKSENRKKRKKKQNVQKEKELLGIGSGCLEEDEDANM